MTTIIILLGIALLVSLAVLFGPMILLYIFGALLALIALILVTPLTVDIKLKDEFSAYLKVWFVKVKLAPKTEKPIKLSDFKIARFRKNRLKEQKEYLLSKRKLNKKKIESDGKKKKEKPQYEFKENVRYGIDLLRLAILRAIKKFGNHLRISLYHLRITVGGNEPDKTAIAYGYICQGVSYLTHIFDRHLNMKYPGKTENRIYVGADFTSPKTKIDLHIAFKIRAWQLVSVGLNGLFGYFSVPKRVPKITNENNPAKAGTEV